MNLREAAWQTAPNAPLGTWVAFEADGVRSRSASASTC